jgi:hypothetical protein
MEFAKKKKTKNQTNPKKRNKTVTTKQQINIVIILGIPRPPSVLRNLFWMPALPALFVLRQNHSSLCAPEREMACKI